MTTKDGASTHLVSKKLKNIFVIFVFILYLFIFTEGFQCHIPEEQVNYMKDFKHYMQNDSNCKPMIECQVVNPYHEQSVLSDSECTNVSVTFIQIVCIFDNIFIYP